MNLPVWAQRLQTLPAPVRRESALPNIYDLIVFVALAALFVLLAEGAESMRAPISALDTSRISLDPRNLPEYALRTHFAHVRGDRRVARCSRSSSARSRPRAARPSW